MTKGKDPGQVIRPGRSEQSDPTNLLGGNLGFSPPPGVGAGARLSPALGPLECRESAAEG